MTPKTLVIVASLVALAPVSATYAQDEGDKPQPTVRMPDGSRERVGQATGRAVERTSAPRPAPPPPAPRAAAPAAAPPAAASAPAPDQRARERQGSRDRGDNPPVGQAVPRGDGRAAPGPGTTPRNDGRNDGNNARAVPRYRGGTNVYVTPPSYNYYYYPRRYYPYGYGAFGLGYFYYDPYTWYPGAYSGYYGGGYPDPFFDSFDVGQLRIDVSPRDADVYVDGYFAGRVDDYDGVFQSLKLAAGPHHIQIVAQGFAPLDFDVRIEPDRKITYRGALPRVRP